MERELTGNIQQGRSVVCVVGSINFDVTLYVTRFPAAGQTISAKKSKLSVGGKGLNQAVAASQAGADVSMIASIGADVLGNMAMEYLKEHKVDASHVKRAAHGFGTGVGNILVDDGGKNQIVVNSGANSCLTQGDIANATTEISNSSVLLSQFESPMGAVEKAMSIARSERVLTILNPAPANPNFIRLFPLASIITPNATETGEYTDIFPKDAASANIAARRLKKLGASTVIITMGEKGCFVSTESAKEYISAYDVNVVDSTGAGDVFNGILASYLSKGESVLDAAHAAMAGAAISVTGETAAGVAPTVTEIVRMMRKC